jgi:anti-sigma factor RsiW
MEHTELQALLYSLDAPGLTESQRQEVQNHLPGCQDCAARLARWQALSARLRQGPPPADSPFFVQRVMSRIEELAAPVQAERWARFRRWAVPVLSLAMAGFVFVVRLPAPVQGQAVETMLSGDAGDADPLSNLLREDLR